MRAISRNRLLDQKGKNLTNNRLKNSHWREADKFAIYFVLQCKLKTNDKFACSPPNTVTVSNFSVIYRETLACVEEP